MKEKLIIVGTGDFAETIYHFLHKTYDVVCFMVHEAYRKEPTCCGKEVIAFEKLENYSPNDYKLIIAVGPNGNNKTREMFFNLLKDTPYELIKYIHPTAYVWDKEAIGANTIIFPNCVVEPFSTIGIGCVLWSGAIVAHHSHVQDFCFLAPGCAISGRVTIEKNCFIGLNSTIRDNITVRENCIVGAGAVIKKDTEKNGVYSHRGTPLYNKLSKTTKV